MGRWLLAVARGRLYRAYGCSSVGEFAREWLGISPSKADALVRLERAGQIAPPLREAYRAGRLSWAQAQRLIPLLKREDAAPWHAAWVAHAERVTVRRLDDGVSRALALGRLEPPPLDPPQGRWPDGRDEAVRGEEEDESASGTHAQPGDSRAGDSPVRDSQTGAPPTPFPKTMAFFFTAPRDVARLFRGALATVQRHVERRNGRTASESETLDAILEHAFETWGLANVRLASPAGRAREGRPLSRQGAREAPLRARPPRRPGAARALPLGGRARVVSSKAHRYRIPSQARRSALPGSSSMPHSRPSTKVVRRSRS